MPEDNKYEQREMMRLVARETVSEMFGRLGLETADDVRSFRESMFYINEMRKRGGVAREAATKSFIDNAIAGMSKLVLVCGGAAIAIYLSSKGVHP